MSGEVLKLVELDLPSYQDAFSRFAKANKGGLPRAILFSSDMNRTKSAFEDFLCWGDWFDFMEGYGGVYAPSSGVASLEGEFEIPRGLDTRGMVSYFCASFGVSDLSGVNELLKGLGNSLVLVWNLHQESMVGCLDAYLGFLNAIREGDFSNLGVILFMGQGFFNGGAEYCGEI